MADYSIKWDGKVPGLGVRTTANGVRSYVLNYRAGKTQRRMTIGLCSDWTIGAAREEARKLRRRIDGGDDPLAKRIEAREAPTVADLWQHYADEHLGKKRTSSQSEDRTMARDYVLPELAGKKVADVTFADISRIHRKVTKTGKPIRANRVLALLSKLFALSVRWGMRPDNPCKGVEKNQEHGRERYLTPEETARLMRAIAGLEDRESANAIMLAFLTGARRSEILKATWDQFDLAKGVWTKAAAFTKQKREHWIILSDHARELLAAMRADAASDAVYLFPNRAVADKGRGSVRPAWEKVCERAGLEGVRFHDLRHSFASFLVSSGVSLPVIGRMLGHTQAQTTLRYAHAHDDVLQDAANRVGAIVSGKRQVT